MVLNKNTGEPLPPVISSNTAMMFVRCVSLTVTVSTSKFGIPKWLR